jgi:hypothetical protein
VSDDKDIQQLLKSVFEPTTEMERDRWPEMSRHMEKSPAAVPWFEWALGGVALALLASSPAALPMLLNWL